MLRLLIPPVLVALFLGWVCYRLFVRKDLRQHLNELYAGLFFIAIWAAVYVIWLQ